MNDFKLEGPKDVLKFYIYRKEVAKVTIDVVEGVESLAIIVQLKLSFKHRLRALFSGDYRDKMLCLWQLEIDERLESNINVKLVFVS